MALKILTVVYGLGMGGTERAAQVFAQAYHELGHDSRVLHLETGGLREDVLRQAGIVLHQGLGPAVCVAITAWEPDLVHLHSHRLEASDVRTIQKLVPSHTRVIETNVFSTPTPWQNDLHLSLQLSDWCRWLYTLRGGSPRSAVVPNPVDTTAFRTAKPARIAAFKRMHQIPEGSPLVGRIGQGYEGKWSPGYVALFSRLVARHPSAVLMVVGAPDVLVRQLQAIDQGQHRLRIVDRIVGDDNLSTAYSAFDVFLHLAEQGESFGFAPLEAMLCGTPVISKSTPWADNSQAEILGSTAGASLVADSHAALNRLLWLLEQQARGIRAPVDRHSLCERFDRLAVARRALGLAEAPALPAPTANQQLPAVLQIASRSTPPPGLLSQWLLACNSSSALRRIRIQADRDWRENQTRIQNLRSLMGILTTLLRHPTFLSAWIRASLQPTAAVTTR